MSIIAKIRKLTTYQPNIAGYEIKVTVTCKAYEGGGYIERVGFYHINFDETPTYEDLLRQATERLKDYKKDWLLTKDNLKKELRDYYYVITSEIYTGFRKQTLAWEEEKIYE